MRFVSALSPAVMLAIVVASACTTQAVKPADSTGAAAPATTAAADPTAVRKAIDEANGRFAAAMMAGDGVAASANYTDGATTMWPNQPAVTTKAAIAKMMGDVFKNVKFSNITDQTADVVLAGDLAIENGVLVMTATPTGGKGMVDTTKYVTVWQKQSDGSWKILRDIFNSNLPAPK